MARVTFFEKSGCAANARQKALLLAAGHELDVRDLRRHFWSNLRLLEFLGDLPVARVVQPGSAGRCARGPSCPRQLDERERTGARPPAQHIPLLIRQAAAAGRRRTAGGFRRRSHRRLDRPAASSRPASSKACRSRRFAATATYLLCADGRWGRRLSSAASGRSQRPMTVPLPTLDASGARRRRGCTGSAPSMPICGSFDIILRTANGTTYNAYAVRGSQGVAIIDTVKIGFSETFFRRLESVADYDEITTVVLNHLEPDHSGALPELLRRARRATLLVSPQARLMLQGLFDPADLAGRSLSSAAAIAPISAIDNCSSSTRRTCTGRIPSAPGWRPKGSCSRPTSWVATIATAVCSTTRSAISASPSITTTDTSCARSAPTCARLWT
jgi:hypothetical protein